MPGPLSYVFWHWPRPEVERESYEAKLKEFLGALVSERPTGLVQALSFRLEALPWNPQRGRWYEDWYVLEDFAALGILNESAVAGRAGERHGSIVKDYMKGAGGVFRSMQGELPLQESRFATWIEKPVGSTYQSYYEGVARMAGTERARLWRRQLVLGPSPQFCLHSEEEVRLPAEFKPVSSRVEALSPG